MALSPIGLWLRRYRRLLPFPLAGIVFLVLTPGGSAGSVELLNTAAGAALCALGQGLRVWTWGSNRLAARQAVRDRGPYALMRHPLYSGNFLILLGSVVVFNNVWAYPLLLLPFAQLYRVIARLDEQQMIRYFGPEYMKYRDCGLPRFLPLWRNWRAALNTTAPFGWAFAWRKEYGSCCAWIAGIIGMEIYKNALAHGYSTGEFPVLILLSACLSICASIGIVITLRTKSIHDRRRRADHSERHLPVEGEFGASLNRLPCQTGKGFKLRSTKLSRWRSIKSRERRRRISRNT